MAQAQIEAGFISDLDREEDEIQEAFEDIVSITKELPGGNGENPGTSGATILASDTMALVADYISYAVDSQGQSGNDNLKWISGTPREGMELELRCFNGSRNISIDNGAGGTGQIFTITGRSVVLTSTNQWVRVKARGAAWYMTDCCESLRIDQLVGGVPVTTLTVASGACAPDRGVHLLDTGGTNQNLDNIGQSTLSDDGRVLVLRGAQPTTSGHVVTVRHLQGGTGQVALAGAASFALDSKYKTLVLHKSGTTWYELFRTGVLGAGEIPALGTALQKLRVNAGATGLEFATDAAGGWTASSHSSAITIVTIADKTRYLVTATTDVPIYIQGASPADGTTEIEIVRVSGTGKITISFSGAAASASNKIIDPSGSWDTYEMQAGTINRLNLVAIIGGWAA